MYILDIKSNIYIIYIVIKRKLITEFFNDLNKFKKLKTIKQQTEKKKQICILYLKNNK